MKCEDGIVVTENYIAVIDGSTSKTSRRYSFTQSNGRFCMNLVSHFIKDAPANLSCHQFCVNITKYIRDQYRLSKSLLRGDFLMNKGTSVATNQDMLQRLKDHPEERLTASAIVYSRLRREIWMIGDCQCLIAGTYYDNPKPHEEELAKKRADIILKSDNRETFLDHDTAREAIIPQMLETMKEQNVTYAVIDGFSIPEQKVRIISLDFQPWEIVMASDGYPFLEPTLEESEKRLRHQLDTDPLNVINYKATKAFMRGNHSFDDRAYIRFQV